MQHIIQQLGIDERFTRPVRKPKVFTKVKDNIPPMEDYNFMADLLMLPNDGGYKYLLVVVDLWTDEFDIEPLRTKTPKEVLKAMKKMFGRPHINKPYATMATDGGGEFKGVFSKYLYDESIYHKTARAGRHTQMGNVERLNRTLARLFNGYMNKKEMETGEVYRGWRDVLTEVRQMLNDYRRKPPLNPFDYEYSLPNLTRKPKFKVGDIVYVQLDIPESATGKKQNTHTFREGDFRYDTTPRKVNAVYVYGGHIPYRYGVSGIRNVAYTGRQLVEADEDEEEFEVKSIIKHREVEDGDIEFLVWWKGYPKAEATWEARSEVVKTAPKIVEAYEKD